MTESSLAGSNAVRRGLVTSVSVSAVHDFSKTPVSGACLLAGLGVEGDAHCGTTVRHRFDRRRDPRRPNLRQVHLIATELLDDLAQRGHVVRPGELGENVTTTGVDLLSLPLGTTLRLGDEAAVRITGLRRPCRLIDAFQAGLLEHMWTVDETGRTAPRAGVMATVSTGGVVHPGDAVTVGLPQRPWTSLRPV